MKSESVVERVEREGKRGSVFSVFLARNDQSVKIESFNVCRNERRGAIIFM